MGLKKAVVVLRILGSLEPIWSKQFLSAVDKFVYDSTTWLHVITLLFIDSKKGGDDLLPNFNEDSVATRPP